MEIGQEMLRMYTWYLEGKVHLVFLTNWSPASYDIRENEFLSAVL